MVNTKDICVLVYGDTICDAIIPYGEMREHIEFLHANPGSTERANPKVKYNLGGGGGNVSGIFAQLGVHTKYLTPLGNCTVTAFLEDELKKKGVDTSVIVHKNTPLAIMMCVLDKNGERTMFPGFLPGTDLVGFDPEDYREELLEGVDCLFICGTKLVFHKEEIPYLIEFVKKAKQKGILVCFDLNLRAEADPVTEERRQLYMELISNCDVILGTIDDEYMALAGTLDEDKALGMFASENNVVVARNGAEPVTVIDHGKVTKHDVLKLGKVLNTVGAGDTSSAAFTVSYIQTKDAEYAIKAANAVAGYRITSETRSVPDPIEIVRLISLQK